MKLSLIIESMRPLQWFKNGLLFIALIFSGNIFNSLFAGKVTLAFIVFCLISGAVYIINDIADRERDGVHPLKSNRPIASGKLGISEAWISAAVLVSVSLVFAFLLNSPFGFIIAGYFVLFILYTYLLKSIVIVDILTLASGFVIRTVAGGVVIDVEISSWLLLCTMLLALFMVIGKRRHEIMILGENAVPHREVLYEYSNIFMEQMIAIVTASTLMAYCFYTISDETFIRLGTKELKYTIPFVHYGIFRYLYLIYRKDVGGTPVKDIFRDIPTIINLFLWIVAVVIILYLR